MTKWSMEHAEGLTPDERENLRGWGHEIPEPPPEPKPPRERLGGELECPHCGYPIIRSFAISELDSSSGRFVRLPKDWTDDEIRAAARFIKRERVSRVSAPAAAKGEV